MKIWKCNEYGAQKLKNEPVPIVGDGNQKDFVHVMISLTGIRIAETNISNKDAWELGTGINYSINELFDFFKERFNIKSIYIPDQPGNYRETLRINNDSLKQLNWKPKDRLKSHIKKLNI